MAIIGVNGIHSHGFSGTRKVIGDLTAIGHDCKNYSYPKRNTLSVWRAKNRYDDAVGLTELAKDGDDIVAHSYGCLIVLEAMILGRVEFGQVFFFGAAASSDRHPWFPLDRHACEHLHVIYNPEDPALRWGSRIPWHPFGKLGFKGYRGPHDSRISNVSALIDGEHNGHLDDGERDKWVHFIDQHVNHPVIY